MFEDTGVGIKNPLWFVGVVENRDDPRKEGRIQVRAFGVHGTNKQVPTDLLPWAICIAGNYDPNYPIPPLNSWVFGFFLDGRDAQQPMILGLIPTQMTNRIEPEKTGWGVIPTRDVELHSQGSRAHDYGEPQNSRLGRGEGLHKTPILTQDVSRVKVDMSGVQDGLELEEPAPSADPVYPLNRVTETAGGHTMEFDDTPSAERVRLGHSEGQFIEMHPNGAMVAKATNDLWLIAEGNIIIVAKEGNQLIKVEGNAAMSVDGDMALDVTGNMRHTVRGNYELSVGGQLNLNGSEEIQARAGKLRLEANVEGLNLKSAKKINMQSGETINMKSATGILQEAEGDFNFKGANVYMQSSGAIHSKAGDSIFQESAAGVNIKGDNLFIESTGNANLKSAQMFLDATGNMNIKGAYTKIGNGQISLNGTSVAIDEYVYLSSGESVTAPGGSGAAAATDAIQAGPAESAEMPEPVQKSVSPASNKLATRPGGTSVIGGAGGTGTTGGAGAVYGSGASTGGVGTYGSDTTGGTVDTGGTVGTGGTVDTGGATDTVGGSDGIASGGYKNPGVAGTGGAVSQDDALCDGCYVPPPPPPEDAALYGNVETNTAAVDLPPGYTQGALKPLLDFISKSEGTVKNGYNTIFGGIKKQHYPPRNITEMTVQEVLDWQDSIDPYYGGLASSEAAGRYQVVEDTLRGLVNLHVVSPSDLYNAPTQDKLAIYLLKDKGLNQFLTGTKTAESFANGIAKVWAGLYLVSGDGAGYGYYPGQRGSYRDPAIILNILNDLKNNTRIEKEFNQISQLQ